MPIDKLTISNFKGIAEKTEFEIKPITLFIGPNSSGKSSCIHALAALAQTVKIANSKLPIVLDDEYAQVHLGRFIEVVHSKSYSDAIKVKGNIHWVSAQHAYECQVRLYDRLFNVDHPGQSIDGVETDYLTQLNANSATTITAQVEPSLKDAKPEDRFQFERHGYFVADRIDSIAGKPVFNRTVTLRDAWQK